MDTRQERGASLRLDLLKSLTNAAPGWAAHGDVEEGLAGRGDIDLIAPEREWRTLEQRLRSWAAEHGLSWVVSCRHRPGILVLLAMPADGPELLDVEVMGSKFFRGTVLFSAERLQPLVESDDRGFRRLRPGASALIKLVPNAVGRLGALKWPPAKAEPVFASLSKDPEAVREAARVFGGLESAVLELSNAAAGGRWSRRAAIALEARALARSARHPWLLAHRGVALRQRRACVVLRSLSHHRLPNNADPSGWMALVERDHAVWRPDDRRPSET
jgi:hypothetical protein